MKKPKPVSIVILLVMSTVACSHFIIHDNDKCEDHPFYLDIKEAYKNSNTSYDNTLEYLLYSKLSKPQDLFERSGLGADLPIPKNPEEEIIQLQTIDALYRQFFKKVKTGDRYYPIDEIKKHYGSSPEERIGISSGGYYRLFVAYWTLKAKLSDYQKINYEKYKYSNIYYVDNIIVFIESSIAGAFFPTPGPVQLPDSIRRQEINKLLDLFAPSMTIKELYEGADPKKVRWPVLQ